MLGKLLNSLAKEHYKFIVYKSRCFIEFCAVNIISFSNLIIGEIYFFRFFYENEEKKSFFFERL